MFHTAGSGRPRVHLEVDQRDEPRVRLGHPQVAMRGTVTVKNLKPGQNYVLYRFNSTEALPDGVAIDLLDVTYQRRYPFTTRADTWIFEDPLPIMSDSATYYVAIEGGPIGIQIADSLKDRVPWSFLAHRPAWNPTNLTIATRPTGDPELALSPVFKSLAEIPVAPQWWAVGALAASGVLGVAVAALHLKRSRSTISVDR